MQRTKNLIRHGAIYGALSAVSFALPLLIWAVLPKIFGDGASHSSTALFAIWTFVNVSLVSLLFLIERGYAASTPLAKKILCLVLLQSALLIGSSGIHRAWDSFPPQNAARDMVEGKNPYPGLGSSPPFIAVIQVACYRSCTTALHCLNKDADPSLILAGIFYAFQWGQLIATGLLFWLLYRYTKAVNLLENRAAIIAGALMLFNFPLQSTLTNNQINVWVTVCILAGMMLAATRPVISGTIVAVGAHLKLYPLAIVPGMLLTGRWRAALSAVAFMIIIAGVQAYCCGDQAIWQHWLSTVKTGGTLFSDHKEMPEQTTITSLVYHACNAASHLLRVKFVLLEPAGTALVGLISLLIVGWFGYRLIRRYASESKATQSYFFALSNDGLCAILLIFPHVWEHHYVLALPIAAYAIARGQNSQMAIIGTFVTFLFYPLGLLNSAPWIMLHLARMLGLVFLACSYAPRSSSQIDGQIPSLNTEAARKTLEKLGI